MSNFELPDDEQGTTTDSKNASGWEREHAVDHADYLDALLDPDDPLHDVARRAAGLESSNGNTLEQDDG